ncbi:MAG: argininosuccinate lyase [bacterium]|nr:argininosuccinate lyase [bacterium]
MSASLQWGGRFAAPPDAALIAFGSSLEDDLPLAPFDVRCSLAHVEALEGGGAIGAQYADALRAALAQVADEVRDGSFAAWARALGAEDVHGAIDARVRELAPEAGAYLHAGRSRNDQVATTLALYARDRAERGARHALAIARTLCSAANDEAAAGTLLAATTHWQPAQPVLLAFWLAAATEPFVRAAQRFTAARKAASATCPLGSAAVAGSTIPLARERSAAFLGFAAPSRNAMDAIGTRDAALDVAHAFVRAVLDASRVAEEIVLWAAPAFGYVRIGDATATGSSLMPQKRNPDALELVRGGASELVGLYGGALSSLAGLALSYHRDLQQTKRLCVLAIERGVAILDAFARAIADVTFVREAMNARAADGYAVATDIADALILRGCSAREAHALVGERVRRAEEEGRALDTGDLAALASAIGVPALEAPLDAAASVSAKATVGSTSPDAVRASLAELASEIAALEARL